MTRADAEDAVTGVAGKDGAAMLGLQRRAGYAVFRIPSAHRGRIIRR